MTQSHWTGLGRLIQPRQTNLRAGGGRYGVAGALLGGGARSRKRNEMNREGPLEGMRMFDQTRIAEDEREEGLRKKTRERVL